MTKEGNLTSFRDYLSCSTSRMHRRGGVTTWSDRDWSELASMRNIKSCAEISFTHDGYYPWLTELSLFSVFHIWTSSSSWSLSNFSYWSFWHLKFITAPSKITICIHQNTHFSSEDNPLVSFFHHRHEIFWNVLPFKSKLRYLYLTHFIKLLSTSDFNHIKQSSVFHTPAKQFFS